MAELIPFRFHVQLSLPQSAGGGLVCNGGFSEISGLEASMSPKTFKEGGRNWGEVQLVGPTTFSTVVLKRGITDADGLWRLFDRSFRQSYYAMRLDCTIDLLNPADPQQAVMTWTLDKVLPIKFKGPDLNATASQVAIEELHLNHEGFVVAWRQSSQAVQGG